MAVADNIRSDKTFMRLALLLEPEIARMLDGHASRVSGYDDAHLDLMRNVVSYFSRGQLLWEARAELIGAFLPDFGLWRWWWTGRMGHSGVKCSMDLALSEGQRHAVATLTTEHPRIVLEDDAALVSNVCAHLARADGVFRSRDAEKVAFYALFDTGRARRSMPPTSGASASMRPSSVPRVRAYAAHSGAPPTSASVSGIPPAAQRPAAESEFEAPQLPDLRGRQNVPHLDDPFAPVDAPREASPERSRPAASLRPTDLATQSAFGREPTTSSVMTTLAPAPAGTAATFGREPTTGSTMQSIAPAAAGSARTAAPIREPARESVLPLVQIAVGAVNAVMPQGFHQALVVLNVDIHEGKARFSTMVVASDERGELLVVDTPRELLEASARMIAEDARSGNGRWRRMTARISRTARGASVGITVI